MNQQQRQMLINTLVALRTMAQDKKRTLISLKAEHEIMYRQARQTFSYRECSNEELDQYLSIAGPRFSRRAVLINDIEDLLVYARKEQDAAVSKALHTIEQVDLAFKESSLPEMLIWHKAHPARLTAEKAFIAATNAAIAGYPLNFIVAGLLGDTRLFNEADENVLYETLIGIFNSSAEQLAAEAQ